METINPSPQNNYRDLEDPLQCLPQVQEIHHQSQDQAQKGKSDNQLGHQDQSQGNQARAETYLKEKNRF